MNLSMTSYALLGMLLFDEERASSGLTGYELKQLCDRTLRFYWVSPAMSLIYTELDRLTDQGLVTAEDATEGRRTTRRFRINDDGREQLRSWLESPLEEPFPMLKHPVALRLLMGHLVAPETVIAELDDYLAALERRRGELQAVRDMLGDDVQRRYPARVAEWGLAYYDAETDIVSRLRQEIEDDPGPSA